MIEIDREELIPLRQLAKFVPSGRIEGKPVHIATVYRWATAGIDGVVLETVLIGGIRFASRASLMRFVQERNGGKLPVLQPPSRDPIRERRTKHLLDKHLSGKRSPERLRWVKPKTA